MLTLPGSQSPHRAQLFEFHRIQGQQLGAGLDFHACCAIRAYIKIAVDWPKELKRPTRLASPLGTGLWGTGRFGYG